MRTHNAGDRLNNNPSNWSMVATHLPGRSGSECREEWRRLERGGDGAAGSALVSNGDAGAQWQRAAAAAGKTAS